MKRILLLILVFVLLLSLSACNLGIDWPENTSYSMPVNGTITFHEMNITIPSDFIRDSTQSSDLFWVFEKGFYRQMILLDARLGNPESPMDVDVYFDSYIDYMIEQGCSSQRTTFQESEAVLSTYTKDGMFCQELMVAFNGSVYTVALRGGTEDDFQTLLETVSYSVVYSSKSEENPDLV